MRSTGRSPESGGLLEADGLQVKRRGQPVLQAGRQLDLHQGIDGRLEQINGNEAYVGVYRGTARDVGRVQMRAAHVALGRQLYVVAGFAPEKEFELVDRDVLPSLRTFRALSQTEAAGVRPNKIDFYTVRAGDSWQSIAVGLPPIVCVKASVVK